MRILHVVSSMDPQRGGTSEAVRQLGLEGQKTGHEVTVATIDAPRGEWIKDFPLSLVPLGPGLTAFQYSSRFQRWLTQNVASFDVVIAHGLWQFTGPAVRRACGQKPYFVFPHGMLDPYFNQFVLKRWKKNLVWRATEYPVLRDARAVFFTADEERLGARTSFAPYVAKEVITPLGIEDPPVWREEMREAFLQKVPAVRGRKFLLFLGRIHPKKGCNMLVVAFAMMALGRPDLHLVIAGPDQTGWVPVLKKMAEKFAISNRISWPEMLTGDAKWGALTLAEAFVLPSHQENFGIAVAEALACGTPVLISNKVNIWREIIAAEAGLAGDNSPQGTLELLQKWALASPPLERKKARQCFENHFRLQSAASHFHRSLERLLA